MGAILSGADLPCQCAYLIHSVIALGSHSPWEANVGILCL